MSLYSETSGFDHYYTWNGTPLHENDYKVKVQFPDGSIMEGLLDPVGHEYHGRQYIDLFFKVTLFGHEMKILIEDTMLDWVIDLDFEYPET